MQRYQGEDLPFSIVITSTETDVSSFDDVDRVVLALYTDESKVVKFEYKSSGTATTGYKTLTLDTSVTAHTKVTGVLPAADTKLMHGQILANLYVKPTDSPAYQLISAAATGIVIKANVLKSESV